MAGAGTERAIKSCGIGFHDIALSFIQRIGIDRAEVTY
jgi:hypothetical protein